MDTTNPSPGQQGKAGAHDKCPALQTLGRYQSASAALGEAAKPLKALPLKPEDRDIALAPIEKGARNMILLMAVEAGISPDELAKKIEATARAEAYIRQKAQAAGSGACAKEPGILVLPSTRVPRNKKSPNLLSRFLGL